MKQSSRTINVALNLVGTIIGAGVFGLPAVMAHTGLVGGTLLFFAILSLTISLHLMYTQVVVMDPVKRRLAGYAGHWVGMWAYWLSLASFFFKNTGALLAYIILGGEFLAVIMHGLGWCDAVWFWQVSFWLLGALIVFFGLRIVTRIESELTWLLIGAMLFTIVVLIPFFDWSNLGAWQLSGFWTAFSVMFFSTTAMTVIPDVSDIANRQKKVLRSGVFWGTIAAGVLSWAFGLSIALAYPGIQGAMDIYKAFPPIFWWLIPVVGVLAVSTSFITLSQASKNLLHLDLKIKPGNAWLISITAPMVMYLLTARDFLSTIGFVGGIFTVINGIFVCLCAWNIMRMKASKISRVWRYSPLPLVLILIIVLLQQLIAYANI